MSGVEVRLIKGEHGGIKEVIFDWNGYKGKSCVSKAMELYDKLRDLGVHVEEKNIEYKPEFYAVVAEDEIEDEAEME